MSEVSQPKPFSVLRQSNSPPVLLIAMNYKLSQRFYDFLLTMHLKSQHPYFWRDIRYYCVYLTTLTTLQWLKTPYGWTTKFTQTWFLFPHFLTLCHHFSSSFFSHYDLLGFLKGYPFLIFLFPHPSLHSLLSSILGLLQFLHSFYLSSILDRNTCMC